jgi:predicted MFS family arabinose efflux permease
VVTLGLRPVILRAAFLPSDSSRCFQPPKREAGARQSRSKTESVVPEAESRIRGGQHGQIGDSSDYAGPDNLAGLMAENRSSSGGHRVGGLLWHRDFRLLWCGETVSQVGTAMAVVAMPLLAVTMLHASTFMVSALVAVAWLPWLLIGLPAGVWVDRVSCRAVMITCDAISAALYASVPAAAWLGVLTIGQLLAVALLGGTASVFFGTAYQAYLPALIAADQLVEGNAKLTGSASVARLGGPGLTGLVAQALSVATALIFDAVSFLASAACLLFIRQRVPGPEASRQVTTFGRDLASGVRLVARDPYLRPMGLFGAIGNLALTGNQALAVVFLVRVVGAGPLAVGLLLAVPGAAGFLGALAARRVTERFGTAHGLILTALVLLPFGLLIPLTHRGAGLAFYIAGTLLAASGATTAGIIIGSFRQVYAPPRMRGRTAATMAVLLAGTSPLGALLGGGLGTAIGIRNALWVLFAIVAVSGLTMLTSEIASQRDLPAVALAEPAAAAA